MIQAVFDYIKENKWRYFVILIMLLVDYSLTIVPTQTTQHIIDEITTQTLTKAVLIEKLSWLALSAIIFYVAQYIWVVQLYGRSIHFYFLLRNQLFNKIVHMRIPFYEKFRSGDMLTRFSNDLENVATLVGYGSMSLLFAFGSLFFVVPAMMLISAKITLFSMIPLVLLGVCIFYLGIKQDHLIEVSRQAVSDVSNEVLEVVEGIRVTRAYSEKALQRQQFMAKTATLRKKADHVMKYQSAYGRIMYFFMSISTAIILYLGAIEISNGRMTLGGVAALQMYSLHMIEPLWVMADFILVYQTGKISYDKVQELIETSDNIETEGTHHLNHIESIKFDHYHFAYANAENRQALRNISITIKKGQTLGIVGKTGSGKTTLVRQLLRQYPVGEGVFELNDIAVTRIQPQSIENKIGYVPQEHVLFSRSVKDNIRVGKEEATDKEIDYAIAVAAFTQDVDRMENGLDTLVGEKGVSISGGQKQRISIARAMVKDPELLILDDSLSAVDAKTERMIIENIQTLRAGKTNIIVSHRLSAVSHAEHIIVLDNGEIVEEGTHESLLAQNGWYRAQYDKQV